MFYRSKVAHLQIADTVQYSECEENVGPNDAMKEQADA